MCNRGKNWFGWVRIFDFYQGSLAGLDLVIVDDGTIPMTGLHGAEIYQGQTLRWTDGNTRITVLNNPAYPVRQVELELWGVRQPRTKLQVAVNNVVLFDGILAEGEIRMTWPLPDNLPPSFDLVLQSSSFKPAGDSRILGVALRRLAIEH